MLQLIHLSKNYPSFSLQDISLDIHQGDYFSLVGKSGSGKTMLLEMIAGFRNPDSGSIILNNENINHRKVQHRNCILLHQDSTLFPHMKVYDNIAYPLQCRGLRHAEARKRVLQMAGFVSAEQLLHRYPGSLSGGEARRVALARSLVVKPHLLMLDEPLVSLDLELKRELQALLSDIGHGGQTILHVTHDFAEAVSLSGKMAVMDHGRMVLTGKTRNLIDNPSNLCLAKLAGYRNFFDAILHPPQEGTNIRLSQPAGSGIQIATYVNKPSGAGFLSFPARDVELVVSPRSDTEASNIYPGVVHEITPQPDGFEVVVDIGIMICASISRNSFSNLGIERNQNLWVRLDPASCRFAPA